MCVRHGLVLAGEGPFIILVKSGLGAERVKWGTITKYLEKKLKLIAIYYSTQNYLNYLLD